MMSFSPANVDAVAAGISVTEQHALAFAFQAEAMPDCPGDKWLLLYNVFSIDLRPSSSAEPFGPLSVKDGRRSMLPDDLTDDEVNVLRSVLSGSTMPVVRARVGDVLWVARKDARAGHTAVPAYLALGTAVESSDDWVACMGYYERAIRLGRSLGRMSNLLTNALQHLLARILHYDGEDTSFFTSCGLILLYEFRFGDAATLGKLALKSADRRRDDGDVYSARAYYEIATRLLARAGLANEAEQARVETAQAWVVEADQAEAAGNHGAARVHLNDAIQVYRAIPRCKHLLPSLHRRLDVAGMATLKQMKSVSSAPINIRPLVEAARASVLGLPMSDAIYALAFVAPPLDPAELRKQAEDVAKKAPLSSMFTSVLYDRAGRIVHKSPGLFTDDPDEREQALDAQIARFADMYRRVIVDAQIMPALMTLLGEHEVEDSDVVDVLQGSFIIPDGRAGLFAMGFAAGFRRDLVTATHILVPQLEHALRVLLRNAGVVTSSIGQDGIQSDWHLGRLLSAAETRTVLHETLIFELRSLLVYKGSSNIRNTLCHGLMAPEDFGTANVFYFWWLLLKIALFGTLGFQAWAEERLRNRPN